MATEELGLKADPEQINRWLANAILESELGKTIRVKAKAVLTSYNFAREVEDSIKRMVVEQARSLVENDEALKAGISAAVARSLTPDLIQKLADAAVAKLHRDY